MNSGRNVIDVTCCVAPGFPENFNWIPAALADTVRNPRSN